jgi:hypothetical protein
LLLLLLLLLLPFLLYQFVQRDCRGSFRCALLFQLLLLLCQGQVLRSLQEPVL